MSAGGNNRPVLFRGMSPVGRAGTSQASQVWYLGWLDGVGITILRCFFARDIVEWACDIRNLGDPAV
jgi:hypothetical protein